MKNTIEVSTKSIIILGNNFISESLYNNYKRNGKLRSNLISDIELIKNTPNYIIDCSFDKNKQDKTICYCETNNIEKILILNHWERTDLPKTKTIILQSVVYDVYGCDHMSFNRTGVGNCFDDSINYCSFISESIRRILEAKIYNTPIVYIPYGECKIKYTHVDNLYEPINYMLINMKSNCSYSIYDDEKSIGYVLNVIKTILDYSGEVIVIDSEQLYTKYIKSLDFYFKKNYFDFEIKRIYNHLIKNNPRFIIY